MNKKKNIALLLILSLVLCMSACTGKDDNGGSKDPENDKAPYEKVAVEKGEWVPAEKGPLLLEVRDNWVNEKREAVDVEYYYFDESKVNYLLVSTETNIPGVFENSLADLKNLLGGQIDEIDGVEFKENGPATVGDNIGGYKFAYTISNPDRDYSTDATEFYTVYQDAVYWFYISVQEDYLEDYAEDIEHIINSLQTADGKGNPLS